MVSFSLEELSAQKCYRLLAHLVGPRPIALVCTVNQEDEPNLAPFSFFNAFSAEPPVVGFSCTRTLRENKLKDTYCNLREVPQCTISVVTRSIVEQVNLCAVDYPAHVNEFEKSGLSPLPSDLVQPPRVAESPAHLECQLLQILELGEGGGAGNLALCKVLKIHISDDVWDGEGVDPHKLDLVGRLGGAFYTRVRQGLFEVSRIRCTDIVGFDRLPQFLKDSKLLRAAQLTQLAGLPLQQSLNFSELQRRIGEMGEGGALVAYQLLQEYALSSDKRLPQNGKQELWEKAVKELLERGESQLALQFALWVEQNMEYSA